MLSCGFWVPNLISRLCTLMFAFIPRFDAFPAALQLNGIVNGVVMAEASHEYMVHRFPGSSFESNAGWRKISEWTEHLYTAYIMKCRSLVELWLSLVVIKDFRRHTGAMMPSPILQREQVLAVSAPTTTCFPTFETSTI